MDHLEQSVGRGAATALVDFNSTGGEDVSEKWADYLISAVRYDAAAAHIEEVQVRLDEGEKVGGPSTWSRSKVIERLEAGYTVVTIFRSDGSWQRGAEVRVIRIDDEKFIRTDADRTKEDNLEDLPSF
jgi:hypothetical protein